VRAEEDPAHEALRRRCRRNHSPDRRDRSHLRLLGRPRRCFVGRRPSTRRRHHDRLAKQAYDERRSRHSGAFESEVEDGRHFGFIRSVDSTSPKTISFDLAYRLDGEAANQAAAERGYPTPVENDYFVVNDNPKLRTVPLSLDVEILLVDWNRCCDDFVTVDPESFQASFGHPEYSSLHPQGEFSQYWVTVAGGTVVKIEEQYRP
jgi:hypothetical protein